MESPHLPMQGNEGQSGVPPPPRPSQIFPGPGRPQVTDPPDPQWAVALTPPPPHSTAPHAVQSESGVTPQQSKVLW